MRIEELERDRIRTANLLTSGGWAWYKEQLVEMSNDVAHQFMTGGHTLQSYESLSARLRLLGELLELPIKKQIDYDLQLKELRATGDDGEEIDPVDLNPMSPVPDYPDDYHRND